MPNETPVTLVKPEPVIVTVVPPVAGPLVGVIPDTIGIGAVLGLVGLLPTCGKPGSLGGGPGCIFHCQNP
jgi:hypothetical protein